MGSPKISESLNRFFAVTQANSGFSANDVINIKGGAAQKAGTFHKWNIFRRLGRSDAEVNANNNTREQFLDALKESFGLTEKGQALVDKLANILGKEVFKPEDYTFKGDKLDCGQPLTTRRITDVYAAVMGQIENERANEAKAATIAENIKPVTQDFNHRLESRVDDMCKTWISKDYAEKLKHGVRAVNSPQGNDVVADKFDLPPQLKGLSVSLFIAFCKSFDMDFEELGRVRRMVSDRINELKESPDFAEACEKREKMIDEWYAATGRNRQEVEDRIIEFVFEDAQQNPLRFRNTDINLD